MVRPGLGADDVRGRAERLLVQGGPWRSRRSDVLSGMSRPRVRQACGRVAVREHGVVGEDQEGDALLAKGCEELVRAQAQILLDQDTVHVGNHAVTEANRSVVARFVRQGSHAVLLPAEVGSVNEFENGCDIARDGACGNDRPGLVWAGRGRSVAG